MLFHQLTSPQFHFSHPALAPAPSPLSFPPLPPPVATIGMVLRRSKAPKGKAKAKEPGSTLGIRRTSKPCPPMAWPEGMTDEAWQYDVLQRRIGTEQCSGGA